uniref:Ribonuclease P protein subunit p29 n=1 Tax=Salmo trutta TaxID=8032 RepID=A0A674A0U0_SALTR
MSVLVHIQSQSDKQAETITNGFLKNSLPGMSEKEIRDFMLHEAVVLKSAKKEKKKRAKGLNAKQLFQLKPEGLHKALFFYMVIIFYPCRYDLSLPLRVLWKQYIRDLCNGLKPEVRNAFNPQTIQQKLLKADFHVAKSKCPLYVGTTGILVQEMKRLQDHHKGGQTEMFVRHISRNSVLAVKIDGFVAHIYGSKFKLRSSEQSAKEFKVKGIIDL